MPNITVLDQSTINQIAAGEVIERPASAVKELVENSIDAGASAITIEIKEGGINFIRITDNGIGIEKGDISLAFLRHSTSKIKTVEDLITVSSLGFRGEALSSIAAVSQVELVTKVNDSFMGIRYVIEGGVQKSIEDIGCPGGTTFIVRNLFFNTPARRKFLKSATTEAGYINEIIERLSLSHPNISFKFISNGQIKLHTSGNANLKDIIYHVYGREISANLLFIKDKVSSISIEGYIGKPVISRGNRNYINYYINGRYIKSSIINRAIEEAYKNYTMVHKYPFTVLHISIDSTLIDINVHPTKMELRFKNSDELYMFILNTIKNGLAGKELIPNVSLVKEKDTKIIENKRSIPEPFESKRRELYNQQNSSSVLNIKESSILDTYLNKQDNIKAIENVIQNKSTDRKDNVNQIKKTDSFEDINKIKSADCIINTDLNKGTYNTKDTNQIGNTSSIESLDQIENTNSTKNVTQVTIKNQQINLFEEKFLSEQSKTKYRNLGQIFLTYWVVEFNEKLYLIDQHAAHEKVLYERTLKNLKNKEYSSQFISPPIIVTLTMSEEEILKKYLKFFKELGFEIEHFGGKEYLISAIPSDLYGLAQGDLFIELIDSLSDGINYDDPSIITEKIASMSCKAAVKGNNKLSYEEANALIDELLKLDNPYNCPHGRPTIISMSKYEIEKKFKRIQD